MDRETIARTMVAAALACALPACDEAEGSGAVARAPAGRDQAGDYGWFKYAAPAGWTRKVPPPGITLAPWVVVFNPEAQEKGERPRLEVWKITDEVSRSEGVPELYEYTLECGWRGQCAEAEKHGKARPAFACERTPAAIGGPGKVEGLSVRIERDGKLRHSLVYFVLGPDGRRFRAMYSGEDPGFTRHRDAVVASLKSLAFPASGPGVPPLSRAEVVAALRKQLDGTRLWLEDGKVAGRRLNDEHLAALSDPAFADVTDLNLVASSAAISSGVDVTDAGLAHIARLPLKSLCLRGSLVTDAGLVYLKGMPLETLVLAETLVKGDGLRHLEGLPLKVLDIDHTRIGDESLNHLYGLPLVMLHVRETRCTEAGVAGLREKRPKVVVGR
jgi:hypothetical protein